MSGGELEILQKQEEEVSEAGKEGVPRAVGRDLMRPRHGGEGRLLQFGARKKNAHHSR